MAGLSEDVRHVSVENSMSESLSKPGMTSISLSRVKDKLPTTMKSSIVYKIPCSRGSVLERHGGGWRPGSRRTWEVGHHRTCTELPLPILWEETSVLDRARHWRELHVHVHHTPGSLCVRSSNALGSFHVRR